MSKGFKGTGVVIEGYVDKKQVCRMPHDSKDTDNLNGKVKIYYIKAKNKDKK